MNIRALLKASHDLFSASALANFSLIIFPSSELLTTVTGSSELENS